MTTHLPHKKFSKVKSYRLAHVEMGSGDPIVLLHGNPTSSYLWRDVMPSLAELCRVIAPDLIGHGDSDKLPVSLGGQDATRWKGHTTCWPLNSTS